MSNNDTSTTGKIRDAIKTFTRLIRKLENRGDEFSVYAVGIYERARDELRERLRLRMKNGDNT